VRQAIRDVIGRDGVVILCGVPAVTTRGLIVLRRIEPRRPVACIFEDIDAIVAEHGEDQLLSLLDGENQVDHVLNLATTNYPEQLDRRFVARPRRFDRIVRVDGADERTRRTYLAAKLAGVDAAELERWVQMTEGLSLAALAEVVISVRCLGNGLEETLALLRRMSAGRASSREFSAGAGFAPRGR
jgi:SpoVK/Ycf46/Vps4 family AAA+-type ATPase